MLPARDRGVRDATAIHTHMCYSEFNDIMPAIAAMDADVISIETTRSRMELLDAFAPGQRLAAPLGLPRRDRAGHMGHPQPARARVPRKWRSCSTSRARRLADWQIWVNPDCGLKTRGWEEVRPAVVRLVEAAQQLREEVGARA